MAKNIIPKIILTPGIVFTLNVDDIENCTYDPATDVWSQPVPPPVGVSGVKVHFTLTNLLADTTSGTVKGRLGGFPLTHGLTRGVAINIKNGEAVQGVLELRGVMAEGAYTLELRFDVTVGEVPRWPTFEPVPIFKTMVASSYSYVAARWHLLETDELNPPYDTSDPNWTATVVTGSPTGRSRYLDDSVPPWEWMPIRNPNDEFDDTTVVSGIVATQQRSGGDLPFTHPFVRPGEDGTGVDYEFYVACDPQFTSGPFYSLLSPGNQDDCDHCKAIQYAVDVLKLSVPTNGVLGVEVDSPFVEPYYTVNEGDQVVMLGRWIADGGEPPGTERRTYAAEIHPPLLLASAHPGDGEASSTTTVSKLSSRPYLVRQNFNGKSLRDHLVDELTRILVAGVNPFKVIFDAAGGDRIAAEPEIATTPFAGTTFLFYRVRPPTRRTRDDQRLVVSYKFVVRTGVAVEIYDGGSDSVGVAVVMNDRQYKPAPLPQREDTTISLDYLKHEVPKLKEIIADVAIGATVAAAAEKSGLWDKLVHWVESLPGINQVLAAAGPLGVIADAALIIAGAAAPVDAFNALGILSRGIRTQQYRLECPAKIDPGEMTTVPISELGGLQFEIDDNQPYPIFGELHVAWDQN